MPVEILQTHKLLASCEEALAARYTVHKLHEAADKDALLAEVERPRPRPSPAAMSRPALMDKLPKLEIIANFGVGYDTHRHQGRQGSATSASPTRPTCSTTPWPKSPSA